MPLIDRRRTPWARAGRTEVRGRAEHVRAARVVRKRGLPILRPLVAAVQWKATLAAGLAGLAAVEVGRALGHPPGSLMQTGRYSLILAAGCAALVIDDPAASTVAASPTPLSFRRAQRIVIGAVALAAGAIPLAIRAGLLLGRLPSRNEVDIALEVLVYAAFGCAGAAVAHRWGHHASAGIAGLSAVMFAFVTSAMLPRYGRLFPPSPFDPHARNHLLVNLALAGVVLVWASCDPAGRRGPFRIPMPASGRARA